METKHEAIAAVGEFTTNVRKIIIGTSDGIKVAGLADKARDAEILLYNDALDPDELILKAFQIEAAERGRAETAHQLAGLVIKKAKRVREIRAKVDGLEDRFKTAVEMAPTDELAVVTFNHAKLFAIQELVGLGIPKPVLDNI